MALTSLRKGFVQTVQMAANFNLRVSMPRSFISARRAAAWTIV